MSPTLRWLSRLWLSPLTLLIGAIMVAALVLGYYTYHSASRLEAKSEESLEQSNRVVGIKLIDRIEKVIIDTDRILFGMVRLDDPKEFQELWRRIVRHSPVVETVAVLDEERRIVHLVSKLPKAGLRYFHKVFTSRIVPEMELPALPLYTHKHLHTAYEGSPYLLSYIRQRSSGRDYYIVLNINLPHLTNDIFREEFGELVDQKFIAVLDEAGRVLWGQAVPGSGLFVFEERFPTTLYRWRLQLAPREVKTLRREAHARRASNLILIAVAVAVILVGMTVLLVAVRKERRANELKSEFISNVTHELKTPLTLIRMFAELLGLGRGSSPETVKEYADIITLESDRLTRLIDNVLDFARIERGKVAYEFQEGSLVPVAERGVELCRHRAEQAGITLVTEIEPDLPATLRDENSLTLLLLNLLENALKYGPSRGGEIHVSLKRHGQSLVLEVKDTGPGIPEEEQSRIFERFYRGVDVRSRGVRGSGIGLSLVKHIAEAHGGGVRVESELGKGATFEVTIPIRAAGPRGAAGGAGRAARSTEGPSLTPPSLTGEPPERRGTLR